MSEILGRGGSKILRKWGVARPVGVAGIWEEDLVNQAFDYCSFLKCSGSFITYVRRTIKEKRYKSSLLCKHRDYGKESPYCFVAQGGLNPLNPPLWSATARTFFNGVLQDARQGIQTYLVDDYEPLKSPIKTILQKYDYSPI